MEFRVRAIDTGGHVYTATTEKIIGEVVGLFRKKRIEKLLTSFCFR